MWFHSFEIFCYHNRHSLNNNRRNSYHGKETHDFVLNVTMNNTELYVSQKNNWPNDTMLHEFVFELFDSKLKQKRLELQFGQKKPFSFMFAVSIIES